MDIIGFGTDAIDQDSLLSEINDQNSQLIELIPAKNIVTGRYQPRKTDITEESLAELTDSIREQGVLQPIIVRKADNSNVYELIAGERRLRASCLADVDQLPCIVKDVSPKTAFAIAVVENMQRKQLSIMEEADALLKLKEEYGMSNDETSKSVGKPRTTVANMIRLAEKIGVGARDYLEKGLIDYGHARAVLNLPSNTQEEVLSLVIHGKWSVRKLETYLKDGVVKHKSNYTSERPKITRDLLEQIQRVTGRKTKVKKLDSGKVLATVFFEDESDALSFFEHIDNKQES